jgi:hypothetical protein
MKNVIACNNCHEENPFYAKTCWKCHSYLRDKVYNIDLWKTIGKLIDNPGGGFKSIILSDHKNFIFAIILFATIKFYLDSLYLTMFAKKVEVVDSTLLISSGIVLVVTLLVIVLFSFLLKIITSSTNAQTRFKDNFAVFSYSLVPHAIGLCILFPIELVLFGGYLFSSNPTPFSIKETLAFIMSGFELLVLLWSLFLSIFAVYIQTRSFLFSLVFAILFNAALFYLLYLIGMLT